MQRPALTALFVLTLCMAAPVLAADTISLDDVETAETQPLDAVDGAGTESLGSVDGGQMEPLDSAEDRRAWSAPPCTEVPLKLPASLPRADSDGWSARLSAAERELEAAEARLRTANAAYTRSGTPGVTLDWNDRPPKPGLASAPRVEAASEP